MVPGMDGYRWNVLRMDAPRIQVAGTRDGRTRVQGWKHLGNMWSGWYGIGASIV
jgi:hypothetical protein